LDEYRNFENVINLLKNIETLKNPMNLHNLFTDSNLSYNGHLVRIYKLIETILINDKSLQPIDFDKFDYNKLFANYLFKEIIKSRKVNKELTDKILSIAYNYLKSYLDKVFLEKYIKQFDQKYIHYGGSFSKASTKRLPKSKKSSKRLPKRLPKSKKSSKRLPKRLPKSKKSSKKSSKKLHKKFKISRSEDLSQHNHLNIEPNHLTLLKELYYDGIIASACLADVYTILRILKNNDITNSIVYVGYLHSKIIYEYLTSIGFRYVKEIGNTKKVDEQLKNGNSDFLIRCVKDAIPFDYFFTQPYDTVF
jgi:hypothetical protein